MTDLSGRHALVTGGGSGVGAAIALRLAEAGARVTISGRQSGPLETTAAAHDNIAHALCDVTDAKGVQTMIAAISKQQGALDIVIANAGAAASRPFAKMTAADLQAMLDVNLCGVFNVWQAALDSVLAAGSGRLIAIASTAGLKGYEYVSAYCAAKHGVVGLTRALALELAQSGVTVNAVCPGFTETPMLERALDNIVQKTGLSRDQAVKALQKSNPQGRFIKPEEVADTVLWLCGTGAGAVTGQAIAVSGGEI